VLFIDVRHLYRQIDRVHRDWTPAQIEFLANIARLYRGEEPENLHDSAGLVAGPFPDGQYADVPGLCKVVTMAEIETQDWSLNPGRYASSPLAPRTTSTSSSGWRNRTRNWKPSTPRPGNWKIASPRI